MSLLLVSACAPEAVVVRHEPPLESPPTRTVVAEPPKPPAPPSDAELRDVASRFVEATEKREFATVRELLAAPLRERYSAQRLAADHDRDPLSDERVARVKQALPKPFVLEGPRAHLSLDSAHALELVHEDAGWRIAALE